MIVQGQVSFLFNLSLCNIYLSRTIALTLTLSIHPDVFYSYDSFHDRHSIITIYPDVFYSYDSFHDRHSIITIYPDDFYSYESFYERRSSVETVVDLSDRNRDVTNLIHSKNTATSLPDIAARNMAAKKAFVCHAQLAIASLIPCLSYGNHSWHKQNFTKWSIGYRC